MAASRAGMGAGFVGTVRGMFFFFSGRAGCLRSLLISVLATGVLWLLFHR